MAWKTGTATAMPSGMLCSAIATVIAMATDGSPSAEAKVAKPSGKLWIAMARAVSMPVRSSRESAAGAANAASGSASPG